MARRETQSVSENWNYWPNLESHYAPVSNNRARFARPTLRPPAHFPYLPPRNLIHTRGRYISDPYPCRYASRQRQPLLNSNSPPLPAFLQPLPRVSIRKASISDSACGYKDSTADYPVSLNVQCEVKSIEATITWDTPAFTNRAPSLFTYFIRVETGERSDVYELANWKTRLSIALTPGAYYSVKVEAVTGEKLVVAGGVAEFKAVFDSYELYRVYHLALAYLRPLNEKSHYPIPGFQRFFSFYRNKPTAYFDHVRFNDNGIMKVYRKDDNGHPASPINGEINGLFFNARMPGGQIPTSSPFGNVRIRIPAEYLFTRRHKLYFCDFYCNNSTHYVTVVCCLPNSLTDEYCSRYLMRLDPANNVFLFVRSNPYTCELEHYVNASIWVEFYYTEDVPVSWGVFDTVHSTGQSKPNGVPNNKSCTACNLYPVLPTTASTSTSPVTSSQADARTKRKPSSDDEIGNDSKRSRPLKPTTWSDFANLKNNHSTFDCLTDLRRKSAEASGERLECTDPDVIDVLCRIVDLVSKDAPLAADGAGSCGQEEEDSGYGSSTSTPAKISDRWTNSTSVEEEDSTNFSSSLKDEEFNEQAEALFKFRNRKSELQKMVKSVEELVKEAETMTADLQKKITKLEQKVLVPPCLLKPIGYVPMNKSQCSDEQGSDVQDMDCRLTSLRQFQQLMMKARDYRRSIVQCILNRRPFKKDASISLGNIERALKEQLKGVDDGVTMTLNGVELDVRDELQMFGKDCHFLSFYETDGYVDRFIDILAESHPRSKAAFMDEMSAVLRMLKSDLSDGIDMFITDWDGTFKTYASSYRTSIQPAYSGLLLALFVKRYTRLAAVLTAGPLRDFGILDSTSIPWEDGYLSFGGSWGREWMINGKRVADEKILTTDGVAALDQLSECIGRLLEQEEFGKFIVVGSGCQRKVDRITVGVQNHHGKVDGNFSRRYVDAILQEVSRIDPRGRLFEVIRLELDLEVVLKASEDKKAWTKADGIEFLMEKVNVDLSKGNVLICGDTSSDLPMVEMARRVNPYETYAVFVNPNEEVKAKLSSLVPGKHLCVGCVEVLHAAMAKQVLTTTTTTTSVVNEV